MRSVAPHCALYLLRAVWPDLSAEGKYLLVQIVLRFGGEWVVWTIERLSRELGMSRAAVIRAREELLMVRFRGGGNFIEKKAFPGLSASDPDMLKGRPRIGLRLAEKFRCWLELSLDGQQRGFREVYIEQLLQADIGGDRGPGRPPGRPRDDSYALAAPGRLLLVVLWARAGIGGVVSDGDEGALASLTGLTLSKMRYQLRKLRKMGYLEYQGGELLRGYVPERCPRIIILNQCHRAYESVWRLRRAWISAEPISDLWGIYVYADDESDDGPRKSLIEEMLGSWRGKLPGKGWITPGQNDELMAAFKGHPQRSQATRYMICKACEYTLTVFCSNSETLRAGGRLVVESVCSRIEEELFSNSELNERFGPNASKLLTIWVYTQIRELASAVCSVICAMEGWNTHEFWHSGWRRCQSIGLMPDYVGRLCLSYTVVPESDLRP